MLRLIVILSALIFTIFSTAISAVSPPQLRAIFKDPIKGHISPIGYRPLTGELIGLVVLANPIGACSKLADLNTQNQQIFILADDTECLQSIKAKNIANSGGYVGLIKQNINNTLHDKEIGLVHIPIIQIPPADYNRLQQFLKDNNGKNVALSLDFADPTQTYPINVEFWFSPTQKESYEFLIANKEFLQRQSEFVSFVPHYVLQSQRQTKNYIGCLSSGRYCPTQIQYQGKQEGKNIVMETLRQIIIWDLSNESWWKYMDYFYKTCILYNEQLFKNSSKLNYCSQNAQIMADLDKQHLKAECQNSFLGSRKQVDDNTYLLEERQLYIREQISSHPTVLINKKMIEIDSEVIKKRICKMQGKKPSLDCLKKKKGLSSNQILIILMVVLAVFAIIAILYRLYIHLRMKREIKTEVQTTLQQYYRYMQTFQGQNGQIGSLKKSNKKQPFITLNEQMEEVPQKVHESIGQKSTALKQVQMQNVSA